MKRVRFAKIWFTASVEGDRYRFDGTYKGKQVSWISDDATLYEDALSDNKRRAKAANLDAIHDTVHEMAKDEARHGRAFEGLLNRYFGK